jgi:hypothetical protein
MAPSPNINQIRIHTRFRATFVSNTTYQQARPVRRKYGRCDTRPGSSSALVLHYILYTRHCLVGLHSRSKNTTASIIIYTIAYLSYYLRPQKTSTFTYTIFYLIIHLIYFFIQISFILL